MNSINSTWNSLVKNKREQIKMLAIPFMTIASTNAFATPTASGFFGSLEANILLGIKLFLLACAAVGFVFCAKAFLQWKKGEKGGNQDSSEYLRTGAAGLALIGLPALIYIGTDLGGIGTTGSTTDNIQSIISSSSSS